MNDRDWPLADLRLRGSECQKRTFSRAAWIDVNCPIPVIASFHLKVAKGCEPGLHTNALVSAFKGLAISSRRSHGAFPDAAGFAMRYTPRPPRPRRRHRLLG